MDKRLSPEKRIGLAIRHARKTANWSQEELSVRSGLHRSYIGAVERGEKNITLRNGVIIAHALGAKLADFLAAAEL